MTIQELHDKQVRAARIKAFYQAHDLLQRGRADLTGAQVQHLQAQIDELKRDILEDVSDTS